MSARAVALPVEAPAETLSLEAMLALRYPSPEWATFFEVQNGTGWEHNRPGKKARRADALAVGIWPSRGYAVHGFEIKRSRSDWLKELADPSKADAVGGFCDRWWLVIADAKLALDSEVPESWGILCPRAGKLVALRDAPKREASPLTRAQIAAILRQVGETTVPKSLVDKTIAEKMQEAREHLERSIPYDLERLQREHDSLKREVDAFAEASGININRYDGGKTLGDAVRLVRTLSRVPGDDRLKQARRHLMELVGNIDRDITVLEKLASEPLLARASGGES